MTLCRVATQRCSDYGGSKDCSNTNWNSEPCQERRHRNLNTVPGKPRPETCHTVNSDVGTGSNSANISQPQVRLYCSVNRNGMIK